MQPLNRPMRVLLILLPVLAMTESCDSTGQPNPVSQLQENGSRDALHYQQVTDLKDQYASRIKQFNAAAANRNPAKPDIGDAQLPDANDYAHQMLDIARRNPQSEAALQASLWVANTIRVGESNRQAVRLIQQYHLDNQRLGELCLTLASNSGLHIDQFLEAVSSQSPHRDVRAIALYSLSKSLNFSGQYSKMLKQGGPQSEATKKLLDATTIKYLKQFKADNERIKRLLRQVIENYPDVKVNDQLMSEVAGQALEYLQQQTN